MTNGSKDKSAKRRVKVKSLPPKAKTVSGNDAKKVKGGVLEDPYILIATKAPNPVKIK